MPVSTWIALLSAIVAALSLAYIIIKDSLSGAREGGKTSVLLADIRRELKRISDAQTQSNAKYEAKFEAYSERLVAVEQSTKSAHKRIDGLEDRITK